MNKQLFLDPPAAYRALPFWFWNGELQEEEIERQIREMAEKGVGGFFISARQGMSVPYLSRRWFELVRFAIERSLAYGLQAWLYDEYPYPSGMAGGEVTLRHPDAVQRRLSRHAEHVTGGRRIRLDLPWGRVLSAAAVPVENGTRDWAGRIDIRDAIGSLQVEDVYQKVGLTAYNHQRYFSYGPRKQLLWDAPDGAWDIVVITEEQLADFKYYGTYVDPCHDEAMRSFVEVTHERYAQELGDLLGGAVPGMFSDEIGFASPTPWSPLIAELFAERTGDRLEERLPELFYSELPDAPRIRYAYFQSLHLKLRSAYHRRVYDWCDNHGMSYVIEVPAVRMTTLRHSHIPGGDSAHEKLGRSLDWILDTYFSSFRNNPKMTSSLSRQLGRERALNECFHSVGWSMTLQDAKWMIDRLAALGINMFNFHAFFYTIGGMTKHDAPPSQFYQNPYWRHFRQLGDYVGRISYYMSQGKADIRVAVLDPTTSLWTHMSNPLHRFAYGGVEAHEAARMERLKKDWADLCNGLLKRQIDYDHLDPELLVEAELQGHRLAIGHASYSVVILPPMSNLEHAAREKLQAFLRAGGTVIANGLLPYEDIEGYADTEAELGSWFGVEASPRASYWEGETSPSQSARSGAAACSKGRDEAYFLPRVDGASLAARIAAAAPSAPELQVLEGKRETLLMQVRRMPDNARTVFVTNQEGEPAVLQFTLPVSGSRITAERVSLETGLFQPLPVEMLPALAAEGTPAAEARRCKVVQQLGPYESLLLRFKEEAAADGTGGLGEGLAAAAGETGGRATSSSRIALDAGQPFKVRALRPNLLRLGEFRLAVEPDDALRSELLGGVSAGEGPVVQAKTVIDQLSDLAPDEQFPLRFEQGFGMPMRYKLNYPLACIYTASFRIEHLPDDCELLMDDRAIAGEHTLYLNGVPIPRESLKPARRYDCGNLVCPVPASWLRRGENVLAVALTAKRDWDGVVDGLYLSGSFAVGMSGGQPVLTAPAETAAFGSEVPAGYAYYAGELSYEGEFAAASLPQEAEFELAFAQLDADFHDCAEIIVNGHSLGTRCWTPYVWYGDSGILREGSNRVEIRRTTVLGGMLEGKRFDYANHRLVDALPGPQG